MTTKGLRATGAPRPRDKAQGAGPDLGCPQSGVARKQKPLGTPSGDLPRKSDGAQRGFKGRLQSPAPGPPAPGLLSPGLLGAFLGPPHRPGVPAYLRKSRRGRVEAGVPSAGQLRKWNCVSVRVSWVCTFFR